MKDRSTFNEAGNIDPIKVGLKSVIIFEAAHALEDIEAQIMVYFYVKAIELIQEDGKVFVQPVSQISSPLKQRLSLPGFIKTCKFVQCH